MNPSLPNELLQNVAFHVVAADPLGPPTHLFPLLLVSKHFHSVLSSASLKARIFRHKFDSGAVSRRCLVPYERHLADQLEIYCRVLRVIKHNDVSDENASHALLAAYVLMLDNDGKNYAQLEWAGVHTWVDTFIRQKLWQGREQNSGWPIDSVDNACALWIAWMTMNRSHLFQESFQAREHFVSLIFPYVLLPSRYPATEAPPNHFHLPFPPTPSPHHQHPVVSSPSYPNYTPRDVSVYPHFGALQSISSPLSSIAAKCLFVARRELSKIKIPHTLPPGLTPADYGELNRSKAAEVVRGARWDWDRGFALAVNPKRLRKNFMPLQLEEEIISHGDEESRKWDTEWWRRILCHDFRAPRPKFPPGLVYELGIMRGTWQGRLYMPDADALNLAIRSSYPGYPTHQPNATFSESSTSIAMLPVFLNLQEHHRICHCPSYHLRDPSHHRPHPPVEKGCGVIPVPQPSIYPPRYMRWRGMRPHYVLLPPEEVEEEEEEEKQEQEQAQAQEFLETKASQGAIEEGAAVAAPQYWGTPTGDGFTMTPDTPVGGGGGGGGSAPVPRQTTPTTTPTGSVGRPSPPPLAQASANPPTAPRTHIPNHLNPLLSLPSSSSSPNYIDFITRHIQNNPNNDPRCPRLVAAPLDYSMSNAWFPGDVVPSLMFVKRKSGKSKEKKRDEIIFGFRESGAASGGAALDWRRVDGRCETCRKDDDEEGGGGVDNHHHHSSESAKDHKLYVYETYDPSRESAHDPVKCRTCEEWDDVRRRERKREGGKSGRLLSAEGGFGAAIEEEKKKESQVEREAIQKLEEFMLDYGRRAGMNMNIPEDEASHFSTCSDDDVPLGLFSTAAASSSSGGKPTLPFGRCTPGCSPPSDSELDDDDDGDDDDDDESSSSSSYSDSRSIEILGDDFPNGQPTIFSLPNSDAVSSGSNTSTTKKQQPHPCPSSSSPSPSSQTSLPRTRRIFDRTRIGAPSGCSGGVRDVVFTGETPRRHVVWHRQKYRVYGRRREWDGLVGWLRVDERSLVGLGGGGGGASSANPGAGGGVADGWGVQGQMAVPEGGGGGGGGQAGQGQVVGQHPPSSSEYWNVLTNMFICGYVIGGNVFVGEWRMAASDPVRPGWSGPILMSLREEGGGELEGEGHEFESVWEGVGGEAV